MFLNSCSPRNGKSFMSSVISHLADFRSRLFSSTKLLKELISFERNFILAARISSSSAEWTKKLIANGTNNLDIFGNIWHLIGWQYVCKIFPSFYTSITHWTLKLNTRQNKLYIMLKCQSRSIVKTGVYT